jgi:hypothetical protein
MLHLSHAKGPPPLGGAWYESTDRFSYVSGNRDHRLSRNRGTLESAQAMAAHESPRTTKLYDRPDDETTLDEVERIAI